MYWQNCQTSMDWLKVEANMSWTKIFQSLTFRLWCSRREKVTLELLTFEMSGDRSQKDSLTSKKLKTHDGVDWHSLDILFRNSLTGSYFIRKCVFCFTLWFLSLSGTMVDWWRPDRLWSSSFSRLQSSFGEGFKRYKVKIASDSESRLNFRGI